MAGRSISFAAGVVESVFDFDPSFFGISPREAVQMDPQQRLLAQLTWEALEHAGLPAAALRGSRAGVFVGASSVEYAQAIFSDLAGLDTQAMTGNSLSVIANRISYLLDLHGPSMTVDTACSSSLMALHQACSAIADGSIDTAIVGGVNLLASPYPYLGFSRAFMLSAQGLCRAFDAAGDGYVRAEGGVVLVLRAAGLARREGQRARARILAWGTNTDGRTTGLALPSRESQAALLREVYDRFSLNPEALAFVEAHGTGTRAGDPMEAGALGEALGRRRHRPLPIGSVKTNIGHLEPASGLAGLLKAVLALEHDWLPPSLHFETPNPDIPFADLNLEVAARGLALERRPDRLAGVNSFGFGGANVHVVIGDGEPPRPPRQRPVGPLLLSAASRPALQALARRHAEMLPEAPAALAAHAAATLWRRDRLAYRAVLAGGDRTTIAAGLAALAEGLTAPGLVLGQAPTTAGPCLFAFAGNGQQWVGMGRVAQAESAAFRASLTATDAVFVPKWGWSLATALSAADLAEKLSRADVSQPLIFAIQLGIAEVLAEFGLRPAAVLGHSAGEVAAACAAGALSRADALRVIEVRTRFQEPMRGKGTMAALVLPEAEAAAALADPAFAGVEIAAVNSGRSLTLAGPAGPLGAFLRHARRQRWPHVRLDIDYPFHSSQLNPFREPMIAALAGLRPQPCATRFFSTVTGTELPGEALDAEYWWRNVREKVAFARALQAALALLRPAVVMEIGATPVLTGYIGDVAREAGVVTAPLASLDRADAAGADPLRTAAARALAHGASLDLDIFAGPAEEEDAVLPAYPWQNITLHLPRSLEACGQLLAPTHPLLGMGQYRDSLTFHAWLDTANTPWLADHKVEAAVVMPAAGMLELTLAAARQALGETAMLELQDCGIYRPLAFTPGVMRQVITQAVPQEGLVLVESRPRGSEEAPTLHARGRFAACPVPPPPAPPPAAQQPCRSATAEAIYALTEAYQLHYGPSFRRLSAVRQLDEVTAEADLAAPQPGWPCFILDPAALDAAFHAVLWMLHGEAPLPTGDVTVVPTFVERLRVFRPGAAVRRARLRLLPRPGGGAFLEELLLLDAEGAVIASLAGGRLTRVTLAGQTEPPAGYEITRILLPPRQPSPPPVLPLAALLPGASGEAVTCKTASKSASGAATALEAAAVAAQHRPAARPATVQHLLAAHPALVAEATLCAGSAEPAAGRALEAALATSPRATALAEAAAEALAAMRAAWPDGQPLRVLALGLGEAGAARQVAARLPPEAGSLVFSDTEVGRLARLEAAMPARLGLRFVGLEMLATESNEFDLALLLDPAGDAPASLAQVLAAILAPGGALLALRAAEGAFAQLLRQRRASVTSGLAEALDAAGFGPAEVASQPGPFGDINALLARRLDGVAAPTHAATLPKLTLLALPGCALAPLAEALSALGVAVRQAPLDKPEGEELVLLADAACPSPAAEPVLAACCELAELLRRLAPGPARLQLVLAGAGAGNPLAAALQGFARVAANEYPKLRLRVIDLAESPISPAALAAELACPDAETELVLAGRARLALRARRREAPAAGGGVRLEILGQGSLERLRWCSAPRRAPGPGEVEIAIEAAGLNFRDVMWALGLLPPEALEAGFAGATLGMECAGRVLRLGEGVEHLAVGDAVVAFADGAFASHATLPGFAVALRPAGLGAEAAATLPVAFVTAWYGLVELAQVEAGEWVLVHGGAGGVGLAALQVLRLRGARVIASAGTSERRRLLLDLGAEAVVDSRSLGFEEAIHGLTSGRGVDVVLNSLAGEAMERSLACLAPFGRFVELGKRDFFANTRLGLRPFRRNLTYFGVDADQLLLGRQSVASRVFGAVMAAFAAGQLRPLPWRGFAAEEAAEAFRLMQQSGHIGKLVIRPPAPAAAAAMATTSVASPPAFARADGSYLIAGGLGGFGLALARRLAARGAGRLLLLGRRGPGPEALAAIKEIRALGTAVDTPAMDAADSAALTRLLDGLPPGQPLRGVFHAAMVLEDGLIAGMDVTRIAPVLHAKLAVAEALEAATAGLTLEHFVLFSSAAVLLGNPGQANYVAANAALEAFARRRRAARLPGLAIGWGALSDAGYLAREGKANRALLARMARHAMTVVEALDGLETLLTAPGPAAVVQARLDWAALSRDLPLLGAPLFVALRRSEVAAPTGSLAEELAAMPEEKARARVLSELVAAISRILRLPPAELDAQRPLAELGVDSLMGVELRLSAEERFGVEVPLLSVSSAGSLADLAGMVMQQLRGRREGQSNRQAATAEAA